MVSIGWSLVVSTMPTAAVVVTIVVLAA
jgi:hypothetical protein